jgi:hypothetical protein
MNRLNVIVGIADAKASDSSAWVPGSDDELTREPPVVE